MSTSRNRKLGAIAVAVVALAGVGTAIAASSFHSHGGTTTTTTAAPGGGYADGGRRGLPPAGSGGFGRGGGRFGGRGGSLSAAATYLGISAQQLFTDLRSGKTLAQIASSTSGKSTAGLIDAMVAAEKSRFDAAVKSGRITQAMANQIEANLKARVTQMVNGGFGGGGFGGRGGFGSPPGGGLGQPGTSPT
ncbi:MAG TPA: hypothetical protein VH538_06900 [Gaiellaceae bacterium]|jgi:hypothetical protein